MLFDVDIDHLKKAMEQFYSGAGTPFSFILSANLAEAEKSVDKWEKEHAFSVMFGGEPGVCVVANPQFTLVVATLQAFLDSYLQENPTVRVDYIHGEQTVTELSQQAGCAGFYLPAISKHDLFKTIVCDGALPRKTFSMGEADEKRFYLECRRIQEE